MNILESDHDHLGTNHYLSDRYLDSENCQAGTYCRYIPAQ